MACKIIGKELRKLSYLEYSFNQIARVQDPRYLVSM
jgi:hypothetical protein